MIIWQRLGIIGVLIPFGLGILSQFLFGETPLNAGIGYLLSAFPVWYIGNKWNSRDENKFKKHTLFWIHLEYWGFLAGLIGLLIIIGETALPIATDSYFIIFGIGLIPILIHQYSKSKSSGKEILSKLLPIRIIKNDKFSDDMEPRRKQVDSHLNLEGKIKKKEVLSSRNMISDSHKAINEFKRKEITLKKFEPSDHSRFIPSNINVKTNDDSALDI